MKSLIVAGSLTLAVSAWVPVALAESPEGGKVEDGEQVYKKCRACHDVGANAKNKVGPLLNGIIGRKAGTVEGFNYSAANKEAGAKGLVWTKEELMKYLANPRAHMPGNRMAFVGLKDAQDRRDVIAYLEAATKEAEKK